jgi:hypothetical protein
MHDDDYDDYDKWNELSHEFRYGGFLSMRILV